jgi:hypothetical protein
MFFLNLLVLMLFSNIFMRVVTGARLQDASAYRACIATPSTCTRLCVPPVALPHRVARAQLSSHEVAVAAGG